MWNLSDEQQMIQKTVRDWAAAKLAPHAERYEHEKVFDVALYKGTTFVQWITWSVVSSTGAYNWTIPSTLATGNDYRITLIDYDQRSITDTSGAFTIN